MIFEKQVIKMYKGMMYTRYDDTGIAYYFSSDDFAGLKKEAYTFTASAGHTLKGYLYHYDNSAPGRIVVFDHGIGGGHRSYMKEIEMLCRNGYPVFAYDHTGCMESGGENTGGMAQSLCDLNDCITAIKANPCFSGVDISVIGHSWGGFSALNISALHPDISHIVVLSGFVSVQECVNSFFPGILRVYRKAIMEIENSSNPYYVNFNAVKTLCESNAKVLLIYSDNDMKCRKTNFDILNSALNSKDNIRFLLVSGKGHNPNYTSDAVNYLGSYIRELQTLTRQKRLVTPAQKADFIASFDWDRMTAQDESVWQEIFACLTASGDEEDPLSNNSGQLSE